VVVHVVNFQSMLINKPVEQTRLAQTHVIILWLLTFRKSAGELMNHRHVWCIVDPADFHDELFLQDVENSPNDQDLLEKRQRTVIQQQEDDLRQMRNDRLSKPGNLLWHWSTGYIHIVIMMIFVYWYVCLTIV